MSQSESNYTQPDLLLLGEDHIRAYRETGGEVGYIWNGVPTLSAHLDRPPHRRKTNLGADFRARRR